MTYRVRIDILGNMNFTLVELEKALNDEEYFNDDFRDFCTDSYADKMGAGALDAIEFIALCKEAYEMQKV